MGATASDPRQKTAAGSSERVREIRRRLGRQVRHETWNAVNAFLQNKQIQLPRTVVTVDPVMTTIHLHGYPIVRKTIEAGDTVIKFNMCGWPTTTTLDRMNAVCETLWGEKLFRRQKGKVWFGPGFLCEMGDHQTITLSMKHFNPRTTDYDRYQAAAPTTNIA